MACKQRSLKELGTALLRNTLDKEQLLEDINETFIMEFELTIYNSLASDLRDEYERLGFDLLAGVLGDRFIDSILCEIGMDKFRHIEMGLEDTARYIQTGVTPQQLAFELKPEEIRQIQEHMEDKIKERLEEEANAN